MKRIISLIVAISMVLSVTFALAVSSASYMIGDLNGDEKINGIDASYLSKFVSGTYSIAETRAADINCDGKINGMDVGVLKKALSGGYVIEQPKDEEHEGTDIELYTVVYPEDATVYETYAAEILCDWVSDNCGAELECVADTAEETEYEILIGNTNRAESVTEAVFEDNQYLLKADGTKLVLQGKDYMIGGAVGDLTYYNVKDGNVLVDEISAENVVLDYTPVEGDNVILMIGDGMGFNHIAFTQFYLRRDSTYEGFIAESFQNKGEAVTYCLSEPTADYRFNKITTDSAASGTALSSGWKTQKGFLGMNAYEIEVKNIREVAYDLGYKTAVISTEGMTGATPSAFTVHTNSRANDQDIIAQQTALVENGLIDYMKGESYDDLLVDTKEALDVISTDSDGFFIMIEEAYIDKACHKLGVGTYTIADVAYYVRRYNSAIQYAATFTAAIPGTVLIVTADHETGSLTKTGGYDATGNHSNVNVPVFAMGYGTEIFNGVAVDNTEIADFMASVYGLESFGGDYTTVND